MTAPSVGLGAKSPAELIELYVFHPNCGLRTFADPRRYFEALSLNEAITTELNRRGRAAVATCSQHLNDLRNIFTGDSGPGSNVAGVCHDLLKGLGHPVPRTVGHSDCVL